MNKKFPSLHLKADDFIPATTTEKENLVVMRDSVNFWKDGFRTGANRRGSKGISSHLRNG